MRLRALGGEAAPAPGGELRSWYFWVRLHRDEIEADEYLGALAYLDGRFHPA